MSNQQIEGRRFVPAANVRKRYDRSDMSLMRWERDQRLGFPRHIKIRQRKFWDEDELDAFDARMAAERDNSPEAA